MIERYWFEIRYGVRWINKTEGNCQAWLDVYPPKWKFWLGVYSERVVSQYGHVWYGQLQGNLNNIMFDGRNSFLNEQYRNLTKVEIPSFEFE